MASPTAAPGASRSIAAAGFGGMLRECRRRSKLSQLELALRANVSQRHVSFLESGRSRPSREMVTQLAEALELSLAGHNQLLTAAGFTGLYPHRRLDATAMAPIRAALDRMLATQEPFPALVMDRAWNVLLTNRALRRLFELVGGMDEMARRVGGRNMMRFTLHPEGLRPYIHNFDEIAAHLLGRATRESLGHGELTEVLEAVRGYPGLPRQGAWSGATPGNGHRPAPGSGPAAPGPAEYAPPMLPVLPTVLRVGDLELRLITTIAGFGTPQDVTADELRVENMFPADDPTEQMLRRLAALSP